MSTEAEIENIREQAWTVCSDFLGGPWTKISQAELWISVLRGGLSNSIFRCALPEDTPTEDPEMPREVLLRIYGAVQDDREHLVKEAVTFMVLSERKLGPKLYGVFSNGRLEEFIPACSRKLNGDFNFFEEFLKTLKMGVPLRVKSGETASPFDYTTEAMSHCLSSDEMRLYAPSVAREMAKVHALDVPLRKKRDFFEVHATKWLQEIKESFQEEVDALFMPYDQCEKELVWMLKEIEKANSPVVFCHNDLQAGNVLYREDIPQGEKPKLVLIDFEFAAYNYREFDFAVYFVERCFDYDTPDYPHFKLHVDRLPSRQEQIEFLRAYFDQASKEGVRLKRPVEEEIQTVLRELNAFACGANFVTIQWSVLRSKTTDPRSKIGPREYAEARKILYHKFKDQYLTFSKTTEV